VDDVQPDGNRELSGKRYLVVEICVLMVLLWLPSGWYALQDALSHGRLYRLPTDPITRLIHDIGALGILLFVLWGAGERFGRFGMGRPRLRDLGIFAAALSLSLAQQVVITRAVSIGDPPRLAPAPQYNESLPLMWWVVAGVYTTTSAAFQEALMRGYLITRLEDLWQNRWPPLVVSCLLFGLWHLYQSALGVAITTVAGVIYGLLFWRFRRLWPIVAAHAVVNLLIAAHVTSYIIKLLAAYW